MSQGCATGLAPYLPEMTAMLTPTLGDARPMVRCISCWVLGRYAKWLLERADTGQRGELDRWAPGACVGCVRAAVQGFSHAGGVQGTGLTLPAPALPCPPCPQRDGRPVRAAA